MIPRAGTAIGGLAPFNKPINHRGKPRKGPMVTPDHSCPKCDHHGNYNVEKIRMLKGPIKYGTRIGLGPDKEQLGIDVPGILCGPVRCVVM